MGDTIRPCLIEAGAYLEKALVIGKSKYDPNVRVMVHDKSSLDPAGTFLAFILGDEEGFRWIGYFDISTEELLSGFKKKKESKTHEAKDLICRMLARGKEVFSDEIDRHLWKKDFFQAGP